MGPLACLASATAFGLLAIFATRAYDAGVEVGTLLLLRFGLAAALLVTIAHAGGRLRGLSRGAVVTALAMGGLGYAAQSGLYFGAVARIDASQVAVLFSGYPLLVVLLAAALGRERVTWRRALALGLALTGTTLAIGGAATGRPDTVGAAFAVAAAFVYAAYIVVGERAADVDPQAFAALVCCGALGTFVVAAAVRGGPDLRFAAAGWLWIGLIVGVSTVAAITLFFAGLARVGPGRAALFATVEPVVTVVAAAAFLGEAMTAVQVAGAVLVLVAVLLVRSGGGPAAGDSDVVESSRYADESSLPVRSSTREASTRHHPVMIRRAHRLSPPPAAGARSR